MNRFTVPLLATLAASVASVPLAAQATITPVAGFGTGGWLAPGAIPQLDTSNSQRGMAVNPATGNLILVDRDGTLGNNAWVIDGATGTVLGSLVPPAGGYSGGTFVVNIPGCGSDGSIHVCNLVTSTASTYKVYSWVSEADGLVNPATTNVSAAGASQPPLPKPATGVMVACAASRSPAKEAATRASRDTEMRCTGVPERTIDGDEVWLSGRHLLPRALCTGRGEAETNAARPARAQDGTAPADRRGRRACAGGEARQSPPERRPRKIPTRLPARRI
ncbi:MAG: hypothetical protein RL562_460 [Planctomycetota bacterium]